MKIKLKLVYDCTMMWIALFMLFIAPALLAWFIVKYLLI